MKCEILAVCVIILLFICVSLDNCLAGSASDRSIWGQESLTGGLWNVGDEPAEGGALDLQFSATQVYQQNVRGGLSTHRRAGRFSGSYDIELDADLEKLSGIENGRVYMLTEGNWSKSGGISDVAVGSYFGVNGDARNRIAMVVTEFWYEHLFAEGSLMVRVGKMDLTGGFMHSGCPVAFDCSMYANDENTQFLNDALINNPTIPFPDYGLGISLRYSLSGDWYVSGAAADAQADIRETGFNTTFHDEDYFFYIFETGLTPDFESLKGSLQGAYRAGIWYDPGPKEKFSSPPKAGTVRDDIGFYVSFDQELYKQVSDATDNQGLGFFGRYGWADSKVNEVTNFWSTGLQYQGLFPGRDEDVLALGFAQGYFSDNSSSFTDDYESVCELYYKAGITPWFELTPDLQYVINPGGDESIDDSLVLSLRALIRF